MKRIITVRHGESEGNKKRIIQGTTTNFGLTDKGKEDIRKIIQENENIFLNADRIVTSPYERTLETAEIINENLQKPVVVSEKLVEFNPGILAGNTHKENKESYPKYYDIWMARKDLDGIPGAEKGEELQARALSFLMEYYNKENFEDIIVSHAGFLRCLVNTANGNQRTTSIDSRNGAINIIDNPFEHIEVEHKSRAMASKVFIVKTVDGKYVIKFKDRKLTPEDFEEKRILDEMQDTLGEVPNILSLQNSEDGCSKVLKFVDGKSFFGILDKTKEQALVTKFKKMQKKLQEIESDVYIPQDLYSEIKKSEKVAKNDYVKEYAQDILKDERNKNKLEAAKYCLIHNDLNRDNILFENKAGQIEVNIIDWEGIDMCPQEYQLASFLVSSFLIEGYSVRDTMKIAKQIDQDIDEDYITYLMKIRVYKGLYFFAEERNKYTQSNESVSQEILKKYFFAAEKINIYRKKSGLNAPKREIKPLMKKLNINCSGR